MPEIINAELINGLGFPIVVCIALIWIIKNILLKLLSTMEELNRTLIQNTETLRHISDRIREDK